MRVLVHAVTRPRVVIACFFGALILVQGGSLVVGGVLLGLAALWVVRLVVDPKVRSDLRLRDEAKLRGVERTLSNGEKNELRTMEAYVESLAHAGAASDVTRDLINHAWGLVRNAGQNDAASDLKALRQSLPTVGGVGGQPQDGHKALQQKLQREVGIINTIERELDKLRP